MLNAIIGVNPGSSGTVSVDGAVRLFTNDYQSAGEFYVGYAGNGLMTVTNVLPSCARTGPSAVRQAARY